MKETQKALVLAHIKKKPLSSWEAFESYGITRLAALVHLLREHYIIQDEWVIGDGSKWKRYWYKGVK